MNCGKDMFRLRPKSSMACAMLSSSALNIGNVMIKDEYLLIVIDNGWVRPYVMPTLIHVSPGPKVILRAHTLHSEHLLLTRVCSCLRNKEMLITQIIEQILILCVHCSIPLFTKKEC